MTLETIRAFFGWCTLVNWGILIIWWVFLMAGRGWIRRVLGGMFGIPQENIGAIHYKMMAYFKAGTILFALTPYIALRIVA